MHVDVYLFKWENKSNFEMWPIPQSDSSGQNCLQGNSLFNICMFNVFKGYFASDFYIDHYNSKSQCWLKCILFRVKHIILIQIFKHYIELYIYIYRLSWESHWSSVTETLCNKEAITLLPLIIYVIKQEACLLIRDSLVSICYGNEGI